eukprot:4426458-Pleurochrysis_carterae.AAC.6
MLSGQSICSWETLAARPTHILHTHGTNKNERKWHVRQARDEHHLLHHRTPPKLQRSDAVIEKLSFLACQVTFMLSDGSKFKFPGAVGPDKIVSQAVFERH